jgi:nucleoside-diphosphate-sugar epimerase
MSLTSRRKVLVCGVTGFIGRNVAETLASRDDLEVLGIHFKSEPFAHPKIRMIRADLTDAREVQRVLSGVDIVVQAAATTSGSKDIVMRPYIHVTDNAVMNSLLFRAAHELNVKHVVFFSCTVMYPGNSDHPVKETDFTGEIHPNYFGVGWTKVYLEKMAEFYSRLGVTKYSVIRHSNIYGPYDKFDLERSHVFGATVTKVMEAQEGKITVWGDGSEERDLLYVDDLVDYVGRVIDGQTAPFDLSNVGGGQSVSIRELVQKVISGSGKEVQIAYDRSKPTIKTKLCVDISKAREAFGWQPKTSLDEGIRKTIQWYKNNRRA